jgi:hypothetical protein
MYPSNWVEGAIFAKRNVSLEMRLEHERHEARDDLAYSAFHGLGAVGASIAPSKQIPLLPLNLKPLSLHLNSFSLAPSSSYSSSSSSSSSPSNQITCSITSHHCTYKALIDTKHSSQFCSVSLSLSLSLALRVCLSVCLSLCVPGGQAILRCNMILAMALNCGLSGA